MHAKKQDGIMRRCKKFLSSFSLLLCCSTCNESFSAVTPVYPQAVFPNLLNAKLFTHLALFLCLLLFTSVYIKNIFLNMKKYWEWLLLFFPLLKTWLGESLFYFLCFKGNFPFPVYWLLCLLKMHIFSVGLFHLWCTNRRGENKNAVWFANLQWKYSNFVNSAV